MQRIPTITSVVHCPSSLRQKYNFISSRLLKLRHIQSKKALEADPHPKTVKIFLFILSNDSRFLGLTLFQNLRKKRSIYHFSRTVGANLKNNDYAFLFAVLIPNVVLFKSGVKNARLN